MTTYASIVVTRNKVYLPTKALTDAGFLLDIEPVYQVDPEPDKVTEALLDALKAGNPKVPTPTVQELDSRSRRNDPLLKATGAKSWKELWKNARSYLLAQSPEKVTLEVHVLDKRGRLVTDSNRIQIFPGSVDTSEIVKAILEDALA